MHTICVEITRFLCPLYTKKSFPKSFFPKTIREWNNLSADTKGADSVKSFKNKLESLMDRKKHTNSYGHGRSTTDQFRMRLGLSHLRSHLFNYNLINTPFCENEVCDHVAETQAMF